MAQEKTRKSAKKTKNKNKTHTYLEKLVSRTEKLSIDNLLDLYKVYDSIVVDHVFRLLLFPYTRFARTWLRDQARDLLAGTDRNRLILTSRARKATETAFEALSKEERQEWSSAVKAKHSKFIIQILRLLNKFDRTQEAPSIEDIRDLGVSRLVYDDLGAYFTALMNNYPALIAERLAAEAEGDHDMVVKIETQLRALETEVGIKRDDAWYVTLNTRSAYDQIDKMVQVVTMAYARLLFRFAHRLRGVTSTEENFSAGYEGMIRAARNYDPVDGSSFTAHCQWWVRSAVLQRQRQSSVIVLPTTTWYQLSLLQRGQVELSKERISNLKERAEMFYANSANASRGYGDDDHDDGSFEATRVQSPDAAVVLGDALHRSQAVEELYEEQDLSFVGRSLFEDVVSLLFEEDPSLWLPVFLWAMNSGIDTTLLAEVGEPFLIDEQQKNKEKQKHIHEKTKRSHLKALKTPTTRTKHGITQESSQDLQQ